MAEYELIQDRRVSGKGLLRVPTDKKKLRHVVLYIDVIRKPRNGYFNGNYNPPRGRYATLNFFREEYLINSIAIDFEKQVFDNVNDVGGQALIAVKCAYEGILESFVNLAVAMSFTPGGIGLTYEGDSNLIAEFANLRLAWDEIKIVCYADTALQVRMYAAKYDSCNPEADDDQPPPPPPPPDEPVPPGTPIDDLSPPYDGDDDDGDSFPYEGDENPEPPLAGGNCTLYRVTYTYEAVNAIGESIGNITIAGDCFGEILDVRMNSNGGGEAFCRGQANDVCGELRWETLVTGAAGIDESDFEYTIEEL